MDKGTKVNERGHGITSSIETEIINVIKNSLQ
jgi:hypothetical protein